jgi:predicted RNA-binding Zn-ribbon protein involved in translation (DUF1610 family)
MDSSQAENPCPNCGGQHYSWGRLYTLALVKGFSLLAARVCDNCGNVQIFLRPAVQNAIDLSKREKRKRQG